MWDALASRAGGSSTKWALKHYDLPPGELWAAVSCGDAAALAEQLTPEAVHASTSQDQATPLHVAALVGQPQAVQALLGCGASIRMRDKNGATPLHVAAQFGQAHVVVQLLAAGADPAAKDRFGQTPFFLAHCQDHKLAMKALQSAVRGKHEDQQEQLFAAFCTRYNKAHSRPLKTVSAPPLPPQEAPPGLEPQTSAPLPSLPEEDIPDASLQAWTEAVRTRDTEAMGRLHSRFGLSIINSTDAVGRTALHRAAACGSVDVLEFCLERGASINAGDQAGRTCLHYAALGAQEEAVSALLRRAVRVNVADEEGRSPLHYAAAYACRGCVVCLVEAGALRSTKDKDGKTPYAWAEEKGNADLLPLLLTRDMVSPEPMLPAVVVPNYIPRATPGVFMCPITHEVMDDPVVAMDGNTYERIAITEWFRRNNTSPMTNQAIADTVIPNRVLRSEIMEWREAGEAEQRSYF